jgi:hypothetical protein
MLHMQPESATLWLVLGKTVRAMTDASNALPDEIDVLRALILTERAAHAAVIAERDKLTATSNSVADDAALLTKTTNNSGSYKPIESSPI